MDPTVTHLMQMLIEEGKGRDDERREDERWKKKARREKEHIQDIRSDKKAKAYGTDASIR